MRVQLLHMFWWSTVLVYAITLPHETTTDNMPLVPVTAIASPPAVTQAPLLHCTDGSTVLHTTDCTMGTPLAYCHKPPPPITCDFGFFPSVWHPDHCLELQTCYPVDADWMVTECSNGAFPYTTSTLYEGTLADGEWTAITSKNKSTRLQRIDLPSALPSGG